ncbi:hypothetical protein DSO57_1016394 [Entomophthora muscae]|uniref:Uncharacterized protein n=1 Tax=Entomophthora muscae TaxID=34485 RepID=A0ACC2S6U1_9FUNG|nr:hypothetical protein DSO57_1016394 [Entomophthora muscae]
MATANIFSVNMGAIAIPTTSLSQWHAKAQGIKHKQIERGKHLEARYTIGDPIYALNPNSAKLKPNHMRPFNIATVYDSHTYQLEDAQGNTKKLHHDCVYLFCAIPTQMLFVRTFPDLLQTLILVSDNKQVARGCCNQVSDLPANLSYNTQWALNGLPLDVSNDMDQSDVN